ncbi:hypothetical protein THAOC_01673, partial [Thalassiosira oceanica]
MQEFNITDEMRARAMDNFITRRLPGSTHTKIEQFEAYIMNLANTFFFKQLIPMAQVALICGGAQKSLPNISDDRDPIVTPVIDALHFARGIQNIRVRDMEWEIPIPPNAEGKPDWT